MLTVGASIIVLPEASISSPIACADLVLEVNVERGAARDRHRESGREVRLAVAVGVEVHAAGSVAEVEAADAAGRVVLLIEDVVVGRSRSAACRSSAAPARRWTSRWRSTWRVRRGSSDRACSPPCKEAGRSPRRRRPSSPASRRFRARRCRPPAGRPADPARLGAPGAAAAGAGQDDFVPRAAATGPRCRCVPEPPPVPGLRSRRSPVPEPPESAVPCRAPCNQTTRQRTAADVKKRKKATVRHQIGFSLLRVGVTSPGHPGWRVQEPNTPLVTPKSAPHGQRNADAEAAQTARQGPQLRNDVYCREETDERPACRDASRSAGVSAASGSARSRPDPARRRSRVRREFRRRRTGAGLRRRRACGRSR